MLNILKLKHSNYGEGLLMNVFKVNQLTVFTKQICMFALLCGFMMAPLSFGDADAHDSAPQATEASQGETTEPATVSEVVEVTEETEDEYSMTAFLGRFHPMVLHFPIALLVLTFLFEIGACFRSSKGFQVAIWATLILANIMLLKTILFGWFLANEGGYNEEALFWHRWLGVGVGALSFILIWLKMYAAKGDSLKRRNWYRGVLFFNVYVLMSGAHHGGELTHGSTYLTENMPPQLKSILMVDDTAGAIAQGDDLFSTKIMPLFKDQCLQCHGPDKQKGDFRVDLADSLMGHSEDGEARVVPFNAMDSLLAKVIQLPASHEDVMPPEGKGELSGDEVMAIFNWINQGAQMPLDFAPDNGTQAIAASALEIDTSLPPVEIVETDDTPTPPLWDELANKTSEVDFGHDIYPILVESCIDCHGEKKQKGKLRLDSPKAILAGADGEPVLVPGDPIESLMYALTILPMDDMDVMPSKGDLLTKEQTDLIKKWITGGAGFGGFTVEKKVHVASLLDIMQEKLPSFTDEQIAFIAAHASEVQVVAQNLDKLLSISMPKRMGQTNTLLTVFEPIKAHIVLLDLSGRTLTDDEFKMLKSFKQLTKLSLKQTNVTDDVLADLVKLKSLRSLNLVNTDITDKGLLYIKQLKGQVYLWQSEISARREVELYRAMTGINIVLGSNWLSKEATKLKALAEKEAVLKKAVEPKLPQDVALIADKFKADSCCDKAAKKFKACDHDCCKRALAQKKVCKKCNAQPKVDKKATKVVGTIKVGSCCDKAAKANKACSHPCCVKALADGTICAKCNS